MTLLKLIYFEWGCIKNSILEKSEMNTSRNRNSGFSLSLNGERDKRLKPKFQL